jgi:hypothetical protein
MEEGAYDVVWSTRKLFNLYVVNIVANANAMPMSMPIPSFAGIKGYFWDWWVGRWLDITTGVASGWCIGEQRYGNGTVTVQRTAKYPGTYTYSTLPSLPSRTADFDAGGDH